MMSAVEYDTMVLEILPPAVVPSSAFSSRLMPTATAKKTPALAQVDAYAVPELLVPRLMKVYKLDQEFAEGIVKEAKRMLYLRALLNMRLCPSVEIDDAWHEMIVFTEFYHDFCNFLGSGYLHHTPEPDSPDGNTGTQGPSLYDETVALYKKHIGAPDERFWTP